MTTLTHGESAGSGTAEYRAWMGMKARCYLKTRKDFSNYGGRGITVCERWLAAYEHFLADMGRRPSPAHSLDRYPDLNGNYEPGNCRWATPSEQALNRRKAAVRKTTMLVDGTKTARDVAAEAGLSATTIHNRYRAGKRGLDLYAPPSASEKSAKLKAVAKARHARMSPEERSARARRAAEVRWGDQS